MQPVTAKLLELMPRLAALLIGENFEADKVSVISRNQPHVPLHGANVLARRIRELHQRILFDFARGDYRLATNLANGFRRRLEYEHCNHVNMVAHSYVLSNSFLKIIAK